VDLTPETEEVASFYATMITTDYSANPVFVKNFFNDWRTFMTHEEKKLIKSFKKWLLFIMIVTFLIIIIITL
jgi:DNA topoisomerase-1